MAKYTNADQLGAALDDILETYFGEVMLAADSGCDEVAKYAKSRLKDLSPRSEALEAVHYADGWAVEKEKDRLGMIFHVWNKNKPGLTHLLEKGHYKRDGKERTKKIPHISEVEKEVEQIIGQKVELKVKKIQ